MLVVSWRGSLGMERQVWVRHGSAGCGKARQAGSATAWLGPSWHASVVVINMPRRHLRKVWANE